MGDQLSVFNEYPFWSPTLGINAARISMCDDRGGEFFMIIPCDGGSKAYRESRAKAVEAIATAIDMGLEPGEVHLC